MTFIPKAVKRSKELALLWNATSGKLVTPQDILRADICELISLLDVQKKVSITVIGVLIAGLSKIFYRKTLLWTRDVDNVRGKMNQLLNFTERCSKSKKKNDKKESFSLIEDCEIEFGVNEEDMKKVEQILKNSIKAGERMNRKLSNITLPEIPSMKNFIDLFGPIEEDYFGGSVDLDDLSSFNISSDEQIEIIRGSYGENIEYYDSFKHSPSSDEFDKNLNQSSFDFSFDINTPQGIHDKQLNAEDSSLSDEGIVLKNVSRSLLKKAKRDLKTKSVIGHIYDPVIKILDDDFRKARHDIYRGCYMDVKLPTLRESCILRLGELFDKPMIHINSSILNDYFESYQNTSRKRRISLVLEEEEESSPEFDNIHENQANQSPNFDNFYYFSPTNISDEENVDYEDQDLSSFANSDVSLVKKVIEIKHDNLESPEFNNVLNAFNQAQENYTFFDFLIPPAWGSSKVVQFFGKLLHKPEYILKQEQKFDSFRPILVIH